MVKEILIYKSSQFPKTTFHISFSIQEEMDSFFPDIMRPLIGMHLFTSDQKRASLADTKLAKENNLKLESKVKAS